MKNAKNAIQKHNTNNKHCVSSKINNNTKILLLDTMKNDIIANDVKSQALYICKVCSFQNRNKFNYDKHLLTAKHIKLLSSIKYNYNCDICNFHTNKKYNYDMHIFSMKHKNKCKDNEMDTMNKMDTTSNICKIKEIDQMNNSELFVSIMSEIKVMMKEQNQTIMDAVVNNSTIVNNSIVNNNNNQTKNQQFNLNMFLNETCKDAMNLSDFIENMQVTMEDMEKTGELGFAKGMSRIIMNNLNAIDICKRPIHCSDAKRETLYVKNNGVWEKETDERNKTKEIIYKVSQLNLKHLLKWRDLPRNKGYEKSDHVKNDEFTNLVIEINKMREEEFDKIITSVSKHVAIDKEKVKDKVKMSGYLN